MFGAPICPPALGTRSYDISSDLYGQTSWAQDPDCGVSPPSRVPSLTVNDIIIRITPWPEKGLRDSKAGVHLCSAGAWRLHFEVQRVLLGWRWG